MCDDALSMQLQSKRQEWQKDAPIVAASLELTLLFLHSSDSKNKSPVKEKHQAANQGRILVRDPLRGW